jgi:hypothetical protein
MVCHGINKDIHIIEVCSVPKNNTSPNVSGESINASVSDHRFELLWQAIKT